MQTSYRRSAMRLRWRKKTSAGEKEDSMSDIEQIAPVCSQFNGPSHPLRISSATMSTLTDNSVSPLRKHAADALARARQLPIGPERNDLRQLAIGLLWLEKKGFVWLEQRGLAAKVVGHLRSADRSANAHHPAKP
jgi:hypothetical protein